MGKGKPETLLLSRQGTPPPRAGGAKGGEDGETWGWPLLRYRWRHSLLLEVPGLWRNGKVVDVRVHGK